MLYSSVDGIRISIEQFTALNCMCRNATPVKNVQQKMAEFAGILASFSVPYRAR